MIETPGDDENVHTEEVNYFLNWKQLKAFYFIFFCCDLACFKTSDRAGKSIYPIKSNGMERKKWNVLKKLSGNLVVPSTHLMCLH